MATVEDLWTELKRDGAHAVIALCSRNEPEGQTLEFKLKAKPENSELTKDDKKNLGKSLSAFSNAVGGILIWGVKTGRRGDDESVAISVDPISDLRAFERRVSSLVAEYLSPANVDVEVKALPLPSGDGFLAIRIGKSERRPHMSMAPDDRRYYGRAGDQSQPLVDYQVRDLLRLKSVPTLHIGCQVERSAVSETTVARLWLSIRNDSELSARHAYLMVRKEDGIIVAQKTPQFPNAQHADRIIDVRQAGSDLVINPGIEVRVVAYHLEFAEISGLRQVRFSPNTNFEACLKRSAFTMNIAVGCEDSPAKWHQLSISSEELDDIATAVLGGKNMMLVPDPVPV